MDISLKIKKATIYNEVAMITSYVGAKMMTENENAYSQVFTTDDDRDMLERFWKEACSSVTDEFKQFIKSVSPPANDPINNHNEVFIIEMSMPSSFDEKLLPSIEQSLTSFFINFVTAKWFNISNKVDAKLYNEEAYYYKNEVRQKIYYRKKPRRNIPTD